jgi:hypothetical protein
MPELNGRLAGKGAKMIGRVAEDRAEVNAGQEEDDFGGNAPAGEEDGERHRP